MQQRFQALSNIMACRRWCILFETNADHESLMTYPVFVYNVLLIATYVLLAAIFVYLYKTRNNSLALWCAVLFGLAFVDNSIFFMKEVFFEINHTETLLTESHWASEMGFQSFFPLVLRMIIGYYIDDKPERKEILALAVCCFIVGCITISFGPQNIVLSALPTVLYAWVFLRGTLKAQGVQVKICLLVLLALYVTDGLLRVFSVLDYVAWGQRNIVIESYWTIYLVLGIYVAATLLRTAEETYTPDENVVFRQFLEQYGLSVREGDIAKLLMKGATNQDISNQLFLALGTVKAHNYHIYKKLKIEHRTQVLIKYTEYLENRAKRR